MCNEARANTNGPKAQGQAETNNRRQQSLLQTAAVDKRRPVCHQSLHKIGLAFVGEQALVQHQQMLFNTCEKFLGNTKEKVNDQPPSLYWLKVIMKIYFLSLLVTVVLANVSVGLLDESDDLKKFQGKWTVLGAELAGEPDDFLLARSPILFVDGNTMTFKAGNSEWTHLFKLDCGTNPKGIDLLGDSVNGKMEVWRMGIYRLDGNTLTLCWDQTKKIRPDGFSTNKNTSLQLVNFSRKK